MNRIPEIRREKIFIPPDMTAQEIQKRKEKARLLRVIQVDEA